MALFLSVEAGDHVDIGPSRITFEAKSGRHIRLRIDSAEDIRHHPADAPEPATPRRPEREATPQPPVDPAPVTRLTRPAFARQA